MVADLQNRTPLSIAFSLHHPAVAAWLITHGAASSSGAATSAETAPASSRGGNTAATATAATITTPPTSSTSYSTNGSIKSSGCVNAAAASSSDTYDYIDFNRYGNVDAKVLLRNAENSDVRKNISEILEEWLHQHSIFTRLVLPATQQRRVHRHIGTSDITTGTSTPNHVPTERSSKKIPSIVKSSYFTTTSGAPASALCILGGHERTLLALIADFIGVLRGRQLRNAREALALLAPAMSPGSKPKESEQAATPPAARNAKKDLGDWCLFSFDY